MSALNSDERHTSSSFSGNVIHEAYGPEPLHFGKLHLPAGPGPHPVIILIHGGFWRVPYDYTLMTGLAEDLVQRDIAVWNIEYRRIGDPDGGWPHTLLDVASAADYLRILAPQHQLDLQRVVPVGHSAGGHLALWLAARPRVAKNTELANASTQISGSTPPLAVASAISLAGVSNLELGWKLNLGRGAVKELLGGSPSEVPERYATASPAALLPSSVPQVLIHGTKDDRVPFEMSEAYLAEAQQARDDVTLKKLEGVEHFALIDASSAAWATTVESIRELLQLR